jgi:endonuclease/exonuclease/phosphatase family metal-dependent hydrolase
VLVLTWNLFHGRSLPPSDRSLLDVFATRLASWEWDVALLQEVPPWWPPVLARACEADQRRALTSRNWGLAFRRSLAERRPELMRSSGGGCNAILARAGIVEHVAVRLRWWPERRVAQLARLAHGARVVNYHGSTSPALASAELARLWELALAEMEPLRPLILGGDLNLRDPAVPAGHQMAAGEQLPLPATGAQRPAQAAAWLTRVIHLAARDVDHIFQCVYEPGAQANGASDAPEELASRGARLDRRAWVDGRAVELSDHIPLLARTL